MNCSAEPILLVSEVISKLNRQPALAITSTGAMFYLLYLRCTLTHRLQASDVEDKYARCSWFGCMRAQQFSQCLLFFAFVLCLILLRNKIIKQLFLLTLKHNGSRVHIHTLTHSSTSMLIHTARRTFNIQMHTVRQCVHARFYIRTFIYVFSQADRRSCRNETHSTRWKGTILNCLVHTETVWWSAGAVVCLIGGKRVMIRISMPFTDNTYFDLKCWQRFYLFAQTQFTNTISLFCRCEFFAIFGCWTSIRLSCRRQRRRRRSFFCSFFFFILEFYSLLFVHLVGIFALSAVSLWAFPILIATSYVLAISRTSNMWFQADNGSIFKTID